MSESMNKNTAPKFERPSLLRRLIGRYAMYKYMPKFPEDYLVEESEVDLDAFAEEIDTCAADMIPQVKIDLEKDGMLTQDVDETELLRIAKCLVLDDLRVLADSEIE